MYKFSEMSLNARDIRGEKQRPKTEADILVSELIKQGRLRLQT